MHVFPREKERFCAKSGAVSVFKEVPDNREHQALIVWLFPSLSSCWGMEHSAEVIETESLSSKGSLDKNNTEKLA